MEDKRFLNAREVAQIMDISVSMAYKIIRRLNDELEAEGCIVIPGRINRTYFEGKICGEKEASYARL